MNDFSISMALVDYIPVILFAMASVILLCDLYSKMSKGAFALFSAGLIDVTVAVYELKYTLCKVKVFKRLGCFMVYGEA